MLPSVAADQFDLHELHRQDRCALAPILAGSRHGIDRIDDHRVFNALGIPRSAVSQLETGQRGVSGLELHRLAQLYSRDVGGFLEDRFEESNPVAAMFRAHPELSEGPAATASLRLCGEVHREVANLRELLELDRGIPPIPEYSLRAPTSKWDAVQQGQHRSRKGAPATRPGSRSTPRRGRPPGSTGYQHGPGGHGRRHLRAHADQRRWQDVLVAANRSHPILRRRFSFAHEYAHVLLDHELKAILSHTRDRSSLMEVRANAFAASFLMPADGVRRYVIALSKGLGSRTRADTFDEEAATRVGVRLPAETQNLEMHDVVRMAHHFGVSCAAILYRLKGLGFVTEEERSSLAEQDGAGLGKALRGFLGLPEADDSDGEMRVHARFVAMAIEAFTRARITQRKLDELGRLVRVSDLSQRLRRAGVGMGCVRAHDEVQ